MKTREEEPPAEIDPSTIGICGGEPKEFDPQWVEWVTEDGVVIGEWVR